MIFGDILKSNPVTFYKMAGFLLLFISQLQQILSSQVGVKFLLPNLFYLFMFPSNLWRRACINGRVNNPSL
jgi:hypothetical protein